MKYLAIAVLVLVPACSKQADQPPAPSNEPAMPEAEIKRGEDACNAYITKACACAEAVPAAKATCDKAKAMPEVITMSTAVMMSKDSSPKDSKQAAMTIRATVKSCIEQTAQLPGLGCQP